MDLEFVIDEEPIHNIFLSLLEAKVSEPALLTFIWNLPVEKSIPIAVRNSSTRHQLTKVYEKTVGLSERFVMLVCHEQGKGNFGSALYGLWLTELELIALFQVNSINANWWIDAAVDHWGRRWLPWAQLLNGIWQPYAVNDDGPYPASIVRNNVRAIGQCIDEYRTLIMHDNLPNQREDPHHG